MSRSRRFALSLAAFAAGVVVTPAAAFLLVADASVAFVAAVAVVVALLVGSVGYALGTDELAARVGESRLGFGLIWVPVLLALALLAGVLLGGDAVGPVLAVAAVGIGTAFLGGAFAWGAAQSEHTDRATAGEDSVVAWEARPPETWWRSPRRLGAVGVVAVVVSLVLSLTVVPEASSLTTFFGGLTGGLVGTAVTARRRRTFTAYRTGVSVETNGTTVFYDWDRVTAVSRTADAVVLRREWDVPWSRLDARADEIDDPEGLAATLRELRG